MLKPMLRRLSNRPVSAPASLDVESTIRLAYTAVLRREPDQAGMAVYEAELRKGRDLAWLLKELLVSSEFLTNEANILEIKGASNVPRVEPAHLLSHEPAMAIDIQCSDHELQGLWDHVSRTWSKLGEEEPHWSVLTNEQFRAEALDDTQLAIFYDSGNFEVRRLNAWLERGGLTLAPDTVCAEFGCGVGRITHSLARQYARVMAFDVSAPHLQTARTRLASDGINNVDFVQVTGKQSLAALRDIDVFYSIIALQHSPPPIILDVLQHAFAALRPGGYAFFQVPTFAKDYSYSATKHVDRISHGLNAQGNASGEMEVHFVPQSTVLQMAQRVGLRVVEVQPDASVGNLERWISNTFLLTRD